jgi:hypothetical protein
VGEDTQVRSAEQEVVKKKRSFWRFGGRYDRAYDLILIVFVISSFILHYRPDRIPEALGAAIGQTFWVAIILFAIFKLLSRND